VLVLLYRTNIYRVIAFYNILCIMYVLLKRQVLMLFYFLLYCVMCLFYCNEQFSRNVDKMYHTVALIILM